MELTQFKEAIDENAKSIRGELDGMKKNIHDIATQVAYQQDGLLMAKSFGAGKSVGFAANAAKEILANSEQLAKHGNLRLEIKAAGDLITTAQVGNTANAGLGAPSALPIGIQYAMNSIQSIGNTNIEYSRYSGANEGSAAVQATEGASKSAFRGVWTLETQPAITVAGYSNISRQSLQDSAQLQTAVNTLLANSLAASIDSLLWNGSGSLFAGLPTIGRTFTSGIMSSVPDAIAEGLAEMQKKGFTATACVISPQTWVEMTVAKASGSGEYLSGSYLGQPMPMIHGVPVTLSNSIEDGQALLIDNRQVELHVVQNPMLEVGFVNDGFIKNVATLLLETRVAPVVKAVDAVTLVIPFYG